MLVIWHDARGTWCFQVMPCAGVLEEHGILDLIRKTHFFSFHCKLDILLVNIIFLAELLDQLLVIICR
jgi:hypothetical protein